MTSLGAGGRQGQGSCLRLKGQGWRGIKEAAAGQGLLPAGGGRLQGWVSPGAPGLLRSWRGSSERANDCLYTQMLKHVFIERSLKICALTIFRIPAIKQRLIINWKTLRNYFINSLFLWWLLGKYNLKDNMYICDTQLFLWIQSYFTLLLLKCEIVTFFKSYSFSLHFYKNIFSSVAWIQFLLFVIYYCRIFLTDLFEHLQHLPNNLFIFVSSLKDIFSPLLSER